MKAKTAAEAARDGARDRETQAKIDLIAAQSAQALAERRRDAANTAKTAAETGPATPQLRPPGGTAETQRDEALAAEMTAEECPGGGQRIQDHERKSELCHACARPTDRPPGRQCCEY